MKPVCLFFGLSLFSFGCNLENTLVPASSDVLNYRADSNQLQSVQNDANAQGGGSDQGDWNTFRNAVFDRFESTLEADLGLPLAILEKVNEVDLEVQADQTVTANFEVNAPFLAQGVDVAATLRLNDATKRIEDEFVIEGVKRLAVQHDLFSTIADAQIFNAQEEVIFTANFTNRDNILNLLLTNANNQNTFLLNADREGLFIGREENHNAEVDQNLEFRAIINTDQLVGKVQVRLIFDIAICFGENQDGQLGRVNCDLVEPDLEGIAEGIDVF